MQKKIIQLYEQINYLGFHTIYYKQYDYVKKAKELIPDIQEFVNWFMSENQFGVEEDLYQELQQNLIVILKDCMTAFEQDDRVLLLDALEYGLGEYLKMFLPENYLEERNNGYHEEEPEK